MGKDEVDVSPKGFGLVTAGRETHLKNLALALTIISWTGSAGQLELLGLNTRCEMTGMQSSSHTGQTWRQ